jgi:hypothetical protein
VLQALTLGYSVNFNPIGVHCTRRRNEWLVSKFQRYCLIFPMFIVHAAGNRHPRPQRGWREKVAKNRNDATVERLVMASGQSLPGPAGRKPCLRQAMEIGDANGRMLNQ